MLSVYFEQPDVSSSPFVILAVLGMGFLSLAAAVYSWLTNWRYLPEHSDPNQFVYACTNRPTRTCQANIQPRLLSWLAQAAMFSQVFSSTSIQLRTKSRKAQ
jgi:hypothetical protein